MTAHAHGTTHGCVHACTGGGCASAWWNLNPGGRRRWWPRAERRPVSYFNYSQATTHVSTALEVLGTLAHVADEGFESTHGEAHRRRGASSATRWGNGLSDQAKHASAIYVRTRCMIGQVRASAAWQAEQTRLDLTKLRVQLGPVEPDPARKEAVVTKLLEERGSFRRLLQGRNRVSCMLERGNND